MKPSLIMQAEPWTITNKETGVVERTGYTLTYFDMESPHIGRKVGFEPLRISGSEDVVKPHLGSIPGRFHLHFRQRANRETGKAELQLTAMAYAAPFDESLEAEPFELRAVNDG